MIKVFCDCCEEEIEEETNVNRNYFLQPAGTEEIVRGIRLKLKLVVKEIDGRVTGAVCKKCIFKALRSWVQK